MADIEAVELLTQAKERLFENGWCAAPKGQQEMCLGEALSGKRGWWGDGCESESNSQNAHARANGFLREAIGFPLPGPWAPSYVWSWNDRQKSAGPIFDAIDRAIEIAKEAPNPHG